MSTLSINRHCWSWRSCFTSVKYDKKGTKRFQNYQSNQKTFSSNDQIYHKHLQTIDENSNILNHYNLSSENTISNEYHQNSISDINSIKNDNENQINDDMNLKLINQKSLSTVRQTQLDAIEEDLNEENSADGDDDNDETIQPSKLCSDRDLINDSNNLYSRLFDLSKTNHIIIQFNDNGYLLGEFTRQIDKLKLKIDDVQRGFNEIPRDAELLEARYSALLATIESLSLLLKVAQISSSRTLINRLIFSIEQRMEQLNKVVQLSLSMNMHRQRHDFNDDDFLSYRSALSSYEHLLSINS